MLADPLGSFLIESAAILLFLGFVSKKLDIDISRFSAVTYAIVLSLYTDDHGLLIIATGLFVISEIDRIQFRIPDVFTKSALFVFTVMANGDWDLLAIAWLWMAVMYVLTFFLPQAIGRGDVKLIGSLILATHGWLTWRQPNFCFLSCYCRAPWRFLAPCGIEGSEGKLPLPPPFQAQLYSFLE